MSDQIEKTLVNYENKIKQLTKDLDFCSGGWNVETTIGSTIYEVMKGIRERHNLGPGGFFNVPKDDNKLADKVWSENALRLFNMPWVHAAKKMFLIGLNTDKNNEDINWNLYHDNDFRSCNDINKIKELDLYIGDLKKELARITKDLLDRGFDSSFKNEYNDIVRVRKKFKLDEE